MSQERQQTPTSNIQLERTRLSSAQKRIQSPITRKVWDVPSTRKNSPFIRMRSSHLVQNPVVVDASPGSDNDTENHLTARINSIATPNKQDDSNNLISWIQSLKLRAQDVLKKEEEEEQRFYAELEKERQKMETENEIRSEQFEKLRDLLNDQDSKIRYIQTAKHRQREDVKPPSDHFDLEEGENEYGNLRILDSAPQEPRDAENPESEEQIYYESQEFSDGLSEELSEEHSDDKREEESHSQIHSELSDFEYDSEGNEIFPSDAEIIQLQSSDIEDGGEDEVEEGEEQGENNYDPSEFQNEDLQYQPQPQYKSMYPSGIHPSNKPKLSDGYQSQPFRIHNGITYSQDYNELEPNEEEEEEEEEGFSDQELDMEEESVVSEEENDEYNEHDVSEEESLTRHASISDIETSDNENVLEETSKGVSRDMVLDEKIANEVIIDESSEEQEASSIQKQELDNDNTPDGMQEFGLLAHAALKRIEESQNTDNRSSIDTLSPISNPPNNQYIFQENDSTSKPTENNHLNILQQSNDHNNSDIYLKDNGLKEAETKQKHSQLAVVEAVQPNVHEIEEVREKELVEKSVGETEEQQIDELVKESEEDQKEIPEQEQEQNYKKDKNAQPETKEAEVETPNSKAQEVETYTEEIYYDSDDNAPYKSPQYSVFGELTGDELSAVHYDYQDEDEDENEFVSGLDMNVTGDREGNSLYKEEALQLKDIGTNENDESRDAFQKLEATAESETDQDHEQNQKSEDEFEEGETSFVSFFNDTSRLATNKANSISFAEVAEDFLKSLSNSVPDQLKYCPEDFNMQNTLEEDVETADIQASTQVEKDLEVTDASAHDIDLRFDDSIGNMEEESDSEESNNVNMENHPGVINDDKQAKASENDIEEYPEGQHITSPNHIHPPGDFVSKNEKALNSSISKIEENHTVTNSHKTSNQGLSPALTFTGIKNLLQQIVDSPVEDSRTSITLDETQVTSSIEKVGTVFEGTDDNSGDHQGKRSQEEKQSEVDNGQENNECGQKKETSFRGEQIVEETQQLQSREGRGEEKTPKRELHGRIKSSSPNGTISTAHNNNYKDQILNEEVNAEGSIGTSIEARNDMGTQNEGGDLVYEKAQSTEIHADNLEIDNEHKTLGPELSRDVTQETEHPTDQTGLFFSLTEEGSEDGPKEQSEESKEPTDDNTELFRALNKSSLTQQLFENVRRAVENPFLDESTPEHKKLESINDRTCPESPLKSNSDASLFVHEVSHKALNTQETAKTEPETASQVSNISTVKSKDKHEEKASTQIMGAEMPDVSIEEAHGVDSSSEKQLSINRHAHLSTEEDNEKNRKASPFKRAFDYLFRHSKYKDSKARKSKFNEDGNEPSGHISKRIKLEELDSGPPTFNGHIIMKTRSGRILGANTSPEVELANEVERREDEYVSGVANDKVRASHAIQDLTADAELIEKSFTKKIRSEQTENSIGGERNSKELKRDGTNDVDNKMDPQEALDYRVDTEETNTSSKKGKKRSRSKTFTRRRLRGDNAVEEADVDNEEKPKEEPESKKSKRRTKKSLPPSERKLRSRTK